MVRFYRPGRTISARFALRHQIEREVTDDNEFANHAIALAGTQL